MSRTLKKAAIALTAAALLITSVAAFASAKPIYEDELYDALSTAVSTAAAGDENSRDDHGWGVSYVAKNYEALLEQLEDELEGDNLLVNSARKINRGLFVSTFARGDREAIATPTGTVTASNDAAEDDDDEGNSNGKAKGKNKLRTNTEAEETAVATATPTATAVPTSTATATPTATAVPTVTATTTAEPTATATATSTPDTDATPTATAVPTSESRGNSGNAPGQDKKKDN